MRYFACCCLAYIIVFIAPFFIAIYFIPPIVLVAWAIIIIIVVSLFYRYMTISVGRVFLVTRFHKHHLLKKGNLVKLFICNSKEKVIILLYKDLKEALPKAIDMLPSGKALVLETHLFRERFLQSLPANLRPFEVSPIEIMPYRFLFNQFLAHALWIINILYRRKISSQPKLWGRQWYRIVWKK
jgi:hypothetical protein